MQPVTIEIRRLAHRWDRANGVLWLAIQTNDGRRYSVGIPVGHYASMLCHYLKREGVICQPEVGEDLQSVDGLFGFVKRVARKASRAVKRATRKVGRAVVRTAKKAIKGVRKAAQKYGAAALKAAASGASLVPGIGSGVAAGLAAAGALAQGKNWKQIAQEAAMGALPGGPMARAALQAGIGVASGQRIDRALMKGVRKAVPGGDAGRAIFDASLAVARGKRLDRAVTGAARNLAMRHVPPHLRGAATAGIAALQGQRVDRAVLGAAKQIAAAQVGNRRPDRMFQAVGGKGLAAIAAANRAAVRSDAARLAAARLRAGQGRTGDRRRVAEQLRAAQGIRRLGRGRGFMARMAVSALKSQPGAIQRRVPPQVAMQRAAAMARARMALGRRGFFGR